MKKALVNGKVYNTRKKLFEEKVIVFEDGIIYDILTAREFKDCGLSVKSEKIDCTGKLIAPSYIDIHTHGAMNHPFDGIAKDSMELSFPHYISHGVGSLFPTSATEEVDGIISLIKRTSELAKSHSTGIRLSGFHAEGPYLSVAKKGAHNAALLKNPSIAELNAMLEAADGLTLRVTVAPEIPGALEYIREAVRLGVDITLGHTDADADCIYRAFDVGANCVTHLYNAMSPLSHRAPGCVGAALVSDVYTELICDGFHIAPDVVKLTYAVKKDKLTLITDSLSCAGLDPNKEFSFESAGETVYYKNGHATLANGTIAGSTLNMHDAVKNLAAFAGISFEEALICGTKAPAEVNGLYSKMGSLDIGKYADMLILDESHDICGLYVGGEMIFSAR